MLPENYAKLAEEYPDELKPRLDRLGASVELNEPHMQEKIEWMKNGFVVKEKFIPDAMLDRYIEFREKLPVPGGFKDPCPYLRHDILREVSLYPPMMELMEELIGHQMGLHLNLTGFKTTTRNWHSDDYLNPAHVYSHYCAVWIALEDIHPDCGPFQMVPGSHTLPPLRRDKLFQFCAPNIAERHDWPTITEPMVSMACQELIDRMQLPVLTYLPKKGDVLFWHGRLIHRGSRANNPDIPRRALIAHYSSIDHRPDMTDRRADANGEVYFHFGSFAKENYKDEYPV